MSAHSGWPPATRLLFSQQLDALRIVAASPPPDIAGDSGNNLLTGTNGNDVFDISQGGSDTVNAKDGDDIVNAGGAFNAFDKINGGTGNDTLNLNGNTNIVLRASTINSVETINLSGSHLYSIVTADASVAAGTNLAVNAAAGGGNTLHFNGAAETDGSFTITGGSGNDILTGGSGNDFFNLGAGGNDTVFGGPGDDLFVFGPGSLNDGDYIDGGSNIAPAGDIVLLFGDFSSGLTIGPAVLNGIELVYLAPGPDPVGSPFNFNLTLSDDNAPQGTVFVVYGADLAANETAVINASAESDDFITLFGGAGNDTLTLGTRGEVNGGYGNDTLTAATGDFTNSGFDSNQLSYYDRKGGGVGVTVNLTLQGIAQNTGGAGIDTITGFGNMIGSQYADTITGDDHNNYIIANGGNDTVSGGNGDDFLAVSIGTSIIKGGNGNDTAAFNGFVERDQGLVSSFSMGATVSLLLQGQVQNFGNGSVTLTSIENLSGSSLDDSLTGDGNANILGGGDGNDTLGGGGGNDTLWGDGAFVPTSVTPDNPSGWLYIYAGNDILDGGGGNDSIHAGGGTDSITGGTGNDSIFMDGNLTAADSVDGGAGSDTVFLDGDYSAGLVLAPTSISNVEQITLAGGHNYDLTSNDGNVAAGQTLILNALALGASDSVTFNGAGESDGKFLLYGGAGNDNLTGGNGDDLIELYQGGDDIANGGAGNDRIEFGFGGALTAADSVDGGAGIDEFTMSADTSLAFAPTTMVNIEKILLGTGHNYYLQPDNANVAAGQTLTIDARTLVSGNTVTVYDGYELDGKLIFLGGPSTDSVVGSYGDDQFTGGLGADSFTPYAGLDTIIYSGVSQSTGTSYDTIVSYDARQDVFDMPFKVKALDAAVTTGSLSTASFDADLGAALTGHLGIQHAVLFTPNAGTLAGQTFLIIDANGVAGYQSGLDYVIKLDSGVALDTLSVADFV